MAVIDLFVFVAGVALGVYAKDPVLKWYKGAEAFAASLKAKADAIASAVKK